MTGRVFLVLLLGIVASAALTQWLAVNERTRALERYRDFHALGTGRATGSHRPTGP